MKMKPKYMQVICMALALAATFALSSTPEALALSFNMTYQNYWKSTNSDNPGWPIPSPAGETGSLVDSVSGTLYTLQAVSSAYGAIYCTPFTAGMGAGAHHQEFWNVWLQLVGEDGEEADL